MSAGSLTGFVPEHHRDEVGQRRAVVLGRGRVGTPSDGDHELRETVALKRYSERDEFV